MTETETPSVPSDTLTGIRGLALLLVLATAGAASGLLPGEFGAGLDQVALMLVVVLSGHLLARRHGTEQFDRYAVGDFLRTRVKRLLPLYYPLLALSAAISPWWTDWPYRMDTPGAAIRAILLVDAPGPLWIAPALAQLYLLFVLVWWVWSRGWPAAVIAAAGVVALAVAVLGWAPVPSSVAAAPYFLLGVGSGLGWATRLEPALRQRERATAAVGAVAFVLACVNLPAVRLAHDWTWDVTPEAATWLDPLSALIVVTLVVTAAARPWTLAVLASVPLRWLGLAFYPVYLVVPVLVALAK